MAVGGIDAHADARGQVAKTQIGFRSFGNLLEEAANRGLLGFGRDDKSGAYVTRAPARPLAGERLPAKQFPRKEHCRVARSMAPASATLHGAGSRVVIACSIRVESSSS